MNLTILILYIQNITGTWIWYGVGQGRKLVNMTSTHFPYLLVHSQYTYIHTYIISSL